MALEKLDKLKKKISTCNLLLYKKLLYLNIKAKTKFLRKSMRIYSRFGVN